MKTVIDDYFYPNMERKQKKELENRPDEKTDFIRLINASAPILPKVNDYSLNN